jgi:cobalt/nickel transport system permease protein
VADTLVLGAALQPRTRLLVAVVLAFGAATVRDVALLPALGAVALAVIAITRPPRAFARRLRAPALLALAIAAALPLMVAGPVNLASDATQAAVLMAARLLAIAAMVLALLSGLSDIQLVAALRGLRVPVLICDLALLTLRYLHDIRTELARARLARTLRGGTDGWRALPEFGALLAVLMIRALRRSERVWAAMRLRGYHGGLMSAPAPLTVRDYMAIGAAVVTALALALLRP